MQSFKIKALWKIIGHYFFWKDFALRCSNMLEDSRATRGGTKKLKYESIKGYRRIGTSWRMMGNPGPSLNSIGLQSSPATPSLSIQSNHIKTQSKQICKCPNLFWNIENKENGWHLMLPWRHCFRQRNRDGADEMLLFYYLDAKAVRITAGWKTTSIYRDNFRSNGFDWGTSMVIVFCVISRAAVQMSVFTHNEAKPALCEPTLISPSQKQ